MIINKQEIITNSAYVYIGDIASKLVLFILNAVAARNLGVIGYGLYIYGINLGLLLINFIDFGTNNFIFKKISEEKGNSALIRQILGFEAILSLVFTAALLVFISFTEDSLYARGIFIILFISLLFENLANVFRSVLRAVGRYGGDSFLNVLCSCLRLIFGLALYYLTYSVYGFSIGITISTLLILLVSWHMVWKIYGGKLRILSNGSLNMLYTFKSCIVFAIPIIIKGIYIRIDSVLIKAFVSSVELSLYNSVTKLLFMQYFLPNGLINVIFPILTRLYYENDIAGANKFFNRVFTVFTIFFNFIQMVQYVFAKDILRIIYGSEFSQAGIIYKIVALSFVFTSLSFLISFLFMSNNKTNLLNRYYCIGLAAKLVLVVPVTLKYGAVGMGAAFLICELIQFAAFLYGAFKNNIEFKRSYLLVLMSVLILDAAIILCKAAVLQVILLMAGHLIISRLFKLELFRYFKEFIITSPTHIGHMRQAIKKYLHRGD